MFQKTIVIVGVGALACGLFVGSASAKHRHHAKQVAPAAKAEAMKPQPGNNPLPIAASTETDRKKYQAPRAYPGNNPMTVPPPK
jgi:hypothetical protein